MCNSQMHCETISYVFGTAQCCIYVHLYIYKYNCAFTPVAEEVASVIQCKDANRHPAARIERMRNLRETCELRNLNFGGYSVEAGNNLHIFRYTK